MTLAKTNSAATPDEVYTNDFYAWTQEQSRLLRAHSHNALDWDNLAEEIGDLGKSVKNEIRSRLRVILTHLLKVAFQPDRRKGGWDATIKVQRRDLLHVLAENPSLRAFPAAALGREYEAARILAGGETGLPESAFPESCPFTVEEVLDADFWPEAGASTRESGP